MDSLWRLLGYLKPYRWTVTAGLLLMLVAQPLTLLHPLFWKLVVDEVLIADHPEMLGLQFDQPIVALGAICLAMLVVHVGGIAVSAVRSYLLETVAQHVGYDIRDQLYQRFQAHSLGYFHDRRSGDLVSRATGDVERVQQFATNSIDEIFGQGLQLIFVWGIIFALSWQIALALLVPMSIVGVMIYRYNRKVRPLYREARDRLGDVSAKVQENISGINVIKAFSREAAELHQVRHESKRYVQSSIAAILARTKFHPSIHAVGFTSNILMLGLGGYFVLQGEFTVGGIVALRGYWWQLFSPIWSLARVNDMFQRSVAAADRVWEVMDEPLEIEDAPDAATLETNEGRLAFDDVTFRYRPELPAVLEGISFTVEPGQMLGVVGSSGAGKSTLLGLILRFFDPASGSVRIDGMDIRRITQQSLRARMAIVTQESFLFAGTVRENLLFSNPDADEQAIDRAAEQANAAGFIASLPNGYDTVVGERGVKLSGGQKQRICIARAFLADPQILLLDEATASVEPESEAIIQAALERLMAGRTSVVVSHRLSMVRNADQILVIQNGRIADRGVHDELMAVDGWYRRMYQLQMGESTLGGISANPPLPAPQRKI